MIKGLRFIPILIAFLLVASCDEFLLKKTVSLEFISGDLTYQPAKAMLIGNMTYTIKNKQDKPLNEVYLVCHPQAIIDSITYNGSAMRFEQGIGYGYGIYRIKIPLLPRNSKAKIGIRYHLAGPIVDNRFVLTDKNVFFDANKIWLPVPFADTPEFGYKITVRTPKDFYAVLSGKMTSETVERNDRTTVWESEIDNGLLTGNIYISSLDRFSRDNIYYYSQDTNNSELVLDYSEAVWKRLNENIVKPPFSQFHIVNDFYIRRDNEEEFIDGLFMANMFIVSSNIFSRSYSVTESDLLKNNIPAMPPHTELAVLELIAHEMSHVYTSSILKFEEDEDLTMESLTEFLSLSLIRSRNQELFAKFTERDRMLMRILYHLGRTNQPLWKYLYGSMALCSAFGGSDIDLSYNFIDILIQKYRYTKITLFELIQTAASMNQQIVRDGGDDVSPAALIRTSFLDLWKANRFYNVSLSTAYLLVTNRTTVTTNYSFTLSNQFPMNINGRMISFVGTNAYTNDILLSSRSSTNFVIDYPVTSMKFDSPYRAYERDLSDNLYFMKTASIPRLVQNINMFYQDSNIDLSLIEKVNQEIDPADAGMYRTLYEDREKYGPMDTYFELDDFIWRNGELYLYVYRKKANTILSYAFIKIIKQHSKYSIVGIFDPLS